jgi:hypothetical protein
MAEEIRAGNWAELKQEIVFLFPPGLMEKLNADLFCASLGLRV